MTIIAKILSSVALLMIYGFLSALILIGEGPGPTAIGTILSLALFGGLIAIWRSKPPIKLDSDSHKLDKTMDNV